MKNLIMLLILSLSLLSTKSLAYSVAYHPPAEKKEVKKQKKQALKKEHRGDKVQGQIKGSTLMIIVGSIFLLGAGILLIVNIITPLTGAGLAILITMAVVALVLFILAIVFWAKEKKAAE